MKYPYYKLYKWTGGGIRKANNKTYLTIEDLKKDCKPEIQYIIAYYTGPYKSTIELCKFSSLS